MSHKSVSKNIQLILCPIISNEIIIQIFAQSINRLNNNRFIVVKVGEIRDKNGAYHNFVGDNIGIFKDLGLHYYNEIILLNQFGTAPLRFNNNFKTRKIVTLHQNILVFYKGDLEAIPSIFNKQNITKDLENTNTKELW